MTCNWLLGRQREESVGEEENLYIPPSSSDVYKRQPFKNLSKAIVITGQAPSCFAVESFRLAILVCKEMLAGQLQTCLLYTSASVVVFRNGSPYIFRVSPLKN